MLKTVIFTLLSYLVTNYVRVFLDTTKVTTAPFSLNTEILPVYELIYNGSVYYSKTTVSHYIIVPFDISRFIFVYIKYQFYISYRFYVIFEPNSPGICENSPLWRCKTGKNIYLWRHKLESKAFNFPVTSTNRNASLVTKLMHI